MTDMLLQDLLEHLRTRFHGKYRGTVTEVDAATMRVKARVPSVFGNDATSGWCSPCVPYAGPQVGFVMLPERGSGVWIEFEGGDISFPIWTGCYWLNGDIPDGTSADLKSIVTKAGSLHFDNEKASVTAQVSSDHTVVLDDSGVTISASSGHQVAVGTSGVSINNDAMEVS
jgi:uncharacterized protein involved in type VI secretion and phage assembly